MTENELFTKLGLSNSVGFKEFYEANKVRDDALSSPSQSSYKEIALD